jgi:hypothetical protein
MVRRRVKEYEGRMKRKVEFLLQSLYKEKGERERHSLSFLLP